MNIIAIDCGASFIKGALIDGKTLEIKKECYEDTPIELDKNLNHLDRTLLKVNYIFQKLSENIEEVSLCLSNEMHGFVVTNHEGNPYLDYVSWQNECALEIKANNENYLDYLKKVLSKETILRIGMPIKAGLPNVNLYYYMYNGIIPKDQKVYFYTLGDYIVKMISGQEPYIHITNAAATGIYDLVNNCWSKAIVDELEFKNIVFPKVGNKSDIIHCQYMNKKVHIYPAIGDQQAALLGAGFFEMDSMSVNFGTGAQVSCIVNEPELGLTYQTRPYFYDMFIKTIPHIPSGRAINVFIRFLKDIFREYGISISNEQVWDVIKNAATKVKENDLQIDLSFFTNAITDSNRGTIANITESNLTLGNLFDSIFEQITENIVIASNRIIQKDSIKKIIFTGGVVCNNEVLRNKIMNRFSQVNSFNIVIKETLRGLAKYTLNQYKYILFDLDGTLVNSQEGVINSLKYSLSKLNFLESNKLDLNKFVGPPLLTSFMTYCGMDKEEAETAVKIYRERYAEKGIYESGIYNGVKDMLISLKKNNKILAVATSKPTVFSEKILENTGIRQYFDAVIGSNLDNTRSKKSEVIECVLKELGFPDNKDVIMIGDRIHDILGAKEANIASMGVLYGYGDLNELNDGEPEFIAVSPEDIAYMLY